MARAERLKAYRARDLKLRDAASLGCPGWLRMSVQRPQAQAALQEIVTGDLP
jgi:histidinol-phosphate aminotransferase